MHENGKCMYIYISEARETSSNDDVANTEIYGTVSAGIRGSLYNLLIYGWVDKPALHSFCIRKMVNRSQE